MDQIKGAANTLGNIDRLLAPSARTEIGKGTNTDFSAVLARAGERASALLPIAKSVQFVSQNGAAPLPMLAPAQPGPKDKLHERALGLRAYRQELLASNIANADTPGYKAVDIDIKEALRNGHSATSQLPVKYQVPSQGSVDGNTVEMDVERAKFAENALMYEFELDRVKGSFKNMDDLLKNTPY